MRGMKNCTKMAPIFFRNPSRPFKLKSEKIRLNKFQQVKVQAKNQKKTLKCRILSAKFLKSTALMEFMLKLKTKMPSSEILST